MGGPGSGNRWQSGRATCEGAMRIDLRYMRKRGFIRPGYYGSLQWSRGGEPSGNINFRSHATALELIYRVRPVGGEWQDVTEWVHYSRTDQHFGGSRSWFLCPRCHRSCLVLYGGTRFHCRQCQRLVYQSQREKDLASRLINRARKIRAKLGDDGGFDDPLPRRPKGMHLRTYNRLIEKCELLEIAADSAMAFHWAKMTGEPGF